MLMFCYTDSKGMKKYSARTWGIIGLAVLIVALLVAALSAFIKSRDVVFSIDGRNYKTAEVDRLIRYPVVNGIKRDDAARTAYAQLKDKAAAKKAGITITETRVQVASEELVYGTPAAKKSVYNSWLRLGAYEMLLKNELKNTANSYQGYSYIFWFGQHLEKGSDYISPDYGNPTLIAADKAYAESRANYYHDQLVAKKIKPADIVTQIQADPKLVYTFQPGPYANASKYFSSDDPTPLKEQLAFSSVNDYVLAQTKPGISGVKLGTSPLLTNKPGGTSDVETHFSFVDIEKVSLHSTADFDKALRTIPASYNGFHGGSKK